MERRFKVNFPDLIFKTLVNQKLFQSDRYPFRNFGVMPKLMKWNDRSVQNKLEN